MKNKIISNETLKLLIEYIESVILFFKSEFLPRVLKVLPLLVVLFVNILWIISDDTTPLWDESRHTINSIRILEAIKNPEKFSLTDGVIWFYDFYTHLSYITAAIFHMIFGMSYDSACLHIGLLWLSLLYFSVYGIARRLLSRNGFVPVISAFVAISFPMVLGISKVFLLDVPALSIVAFAFYIILRTNFLLAKGSWKWATLAVILSFFTKTNSLVFLLWIFVIGFIRGIHKSFFIRSTDVKNFLNNYLVAFSLSFLVIIIWILPNWGTFFTHLREVSYQAGVNEGDPYPFSWGSIIYYPIVFLNEYLLVPLFIFFCFGVYYLVKNKDSKILLLLGYFIIPYLYLTFLHYNKDSRYMLPILVVVSIVIAYPLSLRTIREPIKVVIVILIGLVSLWNIITINFGNLLGIPTLRVFGIEISKNYSHIVSFPNREIEISKNPFHIVSSPNRGIEYNSPEFISKLIGLVSEIKRIEGDNTTTSVVIDIRNSALLSYAAIGMYSMIHKVEFYGVNRANKQDPDIVIVSDDKIKELVKDSMVKIFEKEIPGDKYVIFLNNKLRRWLIFYDPILKNAIGMKITNVFYKDGNIVLDFIWVCKNRNYGDLMSIIEITEGSKKVATLYKEHLIPQGGDGGSFIRSTIEARELKPGSYKITINFKTTYLKDVYRAIPIMFGGERFENLRHHIQVNTFPITLNLR